MLKCSILKGNLTEIADGIVRNGSTNKSEFIRIDGKRIKNMVYDNNISTALSSAMNDTEEVELSIVDQKYFRVIAAVKRANGEISQMTKPPLLVLKLLYLLPSIIIAILFGGLIFSETHSYIGGFFPAIILALAYPLFSLVFLRQSKTYYKARRVFGEEDSI